MSSLLNEFVKFVLEKLIYITNCRKNSQRYHIEKLQEYEDNPSSGKSDTRPGILLQAADSQDLLKK